jgi:hypothetical protein
MIMIVSVHFDHCFVILNEYQRLALCVYVWQYGQAQVEALHKNSII